MVTGWPNLSNPADSVFAVVLGISLFFLVLNTAAMIYFVIRYSRRRNPLPEDVHENMTIEVIWTVVPTILVLIIFFIGWKGFTYMRTAPADAMPVKVIARQWSWQFTYANGKEDSVLRVPKGRAVKLALTSADVVHSLFIPAYRIKEDCVPGRETHLWFQPDTPGSYDLFCTEYCGIEHSSMITKVEVLEQGDFDKWYQGAPAPVPSPAKAAMGKGSPEGARLLQTKGCLACHTTDGTPKIGPTFKGLMGKKEAVISEGKEREITVDEAFIKQKILRPELSRIKGFPPIMPSQQGQVSEKDISRIVEYLKELK